VNALAHIQSRFGIGEGAPSPVELRLSRHGGLTRLWHELGYKVGAEIGTEQGKFAAEICRDNPGVKLYCVDPYTAYDRYEQHQTQEKLDRFHQEAQARLFDYKVLFMRATSMQAVTYFGDGDLDFVFIDANHAYEYVKADIEAWAPKVRAGGMVCGHDYKHEGQERKPLPFGVIQAVNEYVAAHGISPWFVLKGDRCPTWAWVKS
jgi:predicted O-methyltransferase YrrM